VNRFEEVVATPIKNNERIPVCAHYFEAIVGKHAMIPRVQERTHSTEFQQREVRITDCLEEVAWVIAPEPGHCMSVSAIVRNAF
jgi:hypothetical protein